MERVRGSKIVGNERDIHANFCVGLLVLGCALSRRLIALQTERSNDEDELLVENSRLWKVISIIQAGDVQLDVPLASRCLDPIRITKNKGQDEEEEDVEVFYPPVPPQLLHGVDGVVFPLEQAVGAAMDIAVFQMIENVLLTILGSPAALTRRELMIEPIRDQREYELRSREYMRHSVGRFGRSLSEIMETFHRSGVVTERLSRDRIDFRYLERNLDELMHRLRSVAIDRSHDGRREVDEIREIRDFIEHHLHRYAVREGRFFSAEFVDRLEYLVHRLDGPRG